MLSHLGLTAGIAAVVMQAAAQPLLPPPISTNGVRYAPIKPPHVVNTRPPVSPVSPGQSLLPPGFSAPTPVPTPRPVPNAVLGQPAPLAPTATAVPPPGSIPTVVPPVSVVQTTPTLPPDAIRWDAETKESDVTNGQPQAQFTFWLTNVCKDEVLINSVRTSCGCTVAKLPATPWRIAPGSNGPIEVSLNLAGKSGTVVKSVTVDSNTGIKNLLVKANVPVHAPAPVAGASGVQMDRMRNMQLALADRQAPLKGDCAKCHVEPAVDKMGKELYASACSICHNAEHRATSVPDLQALNKPTPPEYWRQFILIGKPGTMMPAYAKEHGGFLTQAQVNSLVDYLVQDFPKEGKIVYHEPAAKPASPTNHPSASVTVPGNTTAAAAASALPPGGAK